MGKIFCKVLNERLVKYLDRGQVSHEGQAGFWVKRSCTDTIYTFNEIVQGRQKEGKDIYILFRQCGTMVCGSSCRSWE